MMPALPNPDLVIDTELTALVQLVAGRPHEFEMRRRLQRVAQAASQCLDQAEASTLALRRRRRPWCWLPTVQIVLSWP